MKAGTERLTCRSDGYDDSVRQLMIEPGEMVFIPITLTPATQTVALRPDVPTTVTWTARRVRADAPWVAVAAEVGSKRRADRYGH